jgi:hypothetical protein
MSTTLIKVLIGLIPATLIFIRAVLLARNRVSSASLLQLCGSACLVIVVFKHIAEALHFLLLMG